MPVPLADTVHLVLRGPATPARARPRLVTLLVVMVLAAAVYGAAMGSYRALLEGAGWQVLFSALKVPLFLLGTLALTLPSFLVLNSLCGFRHEAPVVLRALLEQQAALAIVLASLAPLTLFWYLTGLHYHSAIVLNLGMVVLACLASHRVLYRAYRPLFLADARHYLLVTFWQILFVFVAVQMAWILRPFVGVPHSPGVLLRHEQYRNVYEMIVTTLWRALNR